MPKFPQVAVQLSGRDGNAFAIIGTCTKAAQRAGVDKADIETFIAEATDGDYDNLLRTAIEWFDVS